MKIEIKAQKGETNELERMIAAILKQLYGEEEVDDLTVKIEAI